MKLTEVGRIFEFIKLILFWKCLAGCLPPSSKTVGSLLMPQAGCDLSLAPMDLTNLKIRPNRTLPIKAEFEDKISEGWSDAKVQKQGQYEKIPSTNAKYTASLA